MENVKIKSGKKNEKHILIIDDEENMRHMLKSALVKAGYSVETAINGAVGLEKTTNNHYDFILCDIKMPKLDGIAFLKEGKEFLQNTIVIMMSAYGTIDTAIKAVKLGAFDFISKPFKLDEIILTLSKAEEREKLKSENLELKKQISNIKTEFQFSNMVGKSKSMQAIFKLLPKIGQYDTTILISGESGTGKELIAKAIHLNGTRCDFKLIPLNCGSIPENLLESELFGYKKGAFTGADKDKKGLFEEADKGTLFLDEIGDLPLPLQVKLLRVLQEDEIRPLGSSEIIKIDVRIIAATAKDLEQEVKDGNFREDLYYRLNVIPLKIPSLRERKEDIGLLCDHFLQKYNIKFNKEVTKLSPSVLSQFFEYKWPGNVRELENLVERAMVLTDELILDTGDFPDVIKTKTTVDFSENDFQTYSLKKIKSIVEKKLIARVLEKTNGNRTKSAKLLEISHPSLLSKMKLYKIDM